LKHLLVVADPKNPSEMSLDELFSIFPLSDGNILGFDFDYSTRTLRLRFQGTKQVAQNRHKISVAVLEFGGLIVMDLFEDFSTDGGCTDVTLAKTDNSEYYLSLDPYGNTGMPHERDNWIIRAESLTFIDDDENRYPIT
jgi:hypothetical protein